MTDDRFDELLRTALPPTSDSTAQRDVWPLLVERLNRRTRLSAIDLGLAAAAVIALLMFPEWLWLLAYHL